MSAQAPSLAASGRVSPPSLNASIPPSNGSASGSNSSSPPQQIRPSSLSSTSSPSSSPSSLGIVLIVALTGFAGALVVAVVWALYRIFSRKSEPNSDEHLANALASAANPGNGDDNEHQVSIYFTARDAIGAPEPEVATSRLGSSISPLTYEELAIATNRFSPQNVLGEGGFGRVYKGCLEGGQVVAVKQLKIDGGQGEQEFRAEVETISRVHHRHLVSLVGYCTEDSQRLLVYEYVPNGTLEYHLHGRERPVMNWPTRRRIAIGAARGIAYLHEDCHPRIIHRDIKSANILLDDRFEAQVSDFGLAKFALDAHTHVTTRVMGTFGYLAPEYASTGKLTQRSDVYSFGVVLLELVTGRKHLDTSQPSENESLAYWARPLLSHALEEGNFEALVDPRLENNFNQGEMFRMIEAAAACVDLSDQRRPRMGQVVKALESDAVLADLNNGENPGQGTMYNSADIRRLRRTAFGGQDIGSYFSGVSSEDDMNRSSIRHVETDFESGHPSSEFSSESDYGV